MNFLRKKCALSALFSRPKIGLGDPDFASGAARDTTFPSCSAASIVAGEVFSAFAGQPERFRKRVYSQLDSGKAVTRRASDRRHFMQISGEYGSNSAKIRAVFDLCFSRIEFK